MEQATIVKVFVRRKGFSPQAFDAWYTKKKDQFEQEKAAKKKAAAQPKQ
jgi:hypothetical protein